MQRLFILGLLLYATMGQIKAEYYEYCLKWLAPNTHTLVVEAQVPSQTDTYTDFAIPVWRPGRYITQDYAGAVSHFEAYDPDGNALEVHKVNKDTWRVSYDTEPSRVMVRYRYYANNSDAGSSLYEAGNVYFNPVNLFAYVPGHYGESVRLEVPDLPEDWKVASALTRGEKYNVFTATDYHEFVDSPTIFASEMKQLSFEDQGTRFYIHLHGNYQGDAETDKALIEMAHKICQEQAAIFGGYPFDEYHFIYRLLPINLRHAVEHSRSASFALPDRITQTARMAVGSMAGITAHELFHAWNVKRIRPAALWPYDYSEPQYTRLHWFTEGVTDYYADLTLVRAGLTSHEDFLASLSGTIERIENSYAATVTSPSRSSFDSWLASSPYVHPDHRISYYTLGSRVGFMIDAELIAQTNGDKRLDDVFRYLYETYYSNDEGVPEDGVQQALEKLSGESWQEFFDQYVHGTEPVAYGNLIAPLGLMLDVESKQVGDLRAFGIPSSDKLNQGILIRRVHPGGDAYEAGISTNDLLLEIDGLNATTIDLAGLIEDLEHGDKLDLTILRNGAIEQLTLEYRGRFSPRSFNLVPAERIQKLSQEHYNFWLTPVTER